MKYAHRKRIFLTANNGVNLNNVKEKVLEGLVKYKFRSMTCSIDGTKNETYAKYRVGGNYDIVINNIKIINEFKKIYQTKYPLLSWQFVLCGHNEKELSKAKNIAKSLKMNFHSKLSWDSELSPWDREIAEREFYIASRELYKEKYGIHYMQYVCNQLWDKPQINWDGKVLGCDRNYWKEFGGNAFDDGLLNVLNTEKFHYAKGMLLGINLERNDIPCTTCDIYLVMKTNSRWLDRSAKKKLYIFLSRFVPHKLKYAIKKYIK